MGLRIRVHRVQGSDGLNISGLWLGSSGFRD